MKDLVAYWADTYDWRHWEGRINALRNYTADIEGQKIHFIVECGSGPNPTPLLLTHGWPGSFVEFLDIVDPLAHPERHGAPNDMAFTVVMRSLPGFGFSAAPARPLEPREIAKILKILMVDVLGFERFAAQGGDWGAIITSWLALDFPSHVRAIHLNMIGLRPFLEPSAPDLTGAESEWLRLSQERRTTISAYQQIQGTKPRTLAYGLTDSPAGLAGWIFEKFHDWTIPGESKPLPFNVDQLLTNVTIYWIQGINTANWIYVSLVNGTATTLQAGQRISVPTAVLLFPKDLIIPPPRSWIERTYELKQYTLEGDGGHFPAMENGGCLIADMRKFYASHW